MNPKYIALLIISFLPLKIKASNCFELRSFYRTSKNVNIHADKNLFIKPSINAVIYGISINGKITRMANNYLVRILLKDDVGEEHLILEAYKEIFDDEVIRLDNYCEETAILDGIKPDSLKIYVSGASVTINSYNYKCNANNDNKAEERGLLRSSQVSEIVDRINSYNMSHKKLWRAGVTPLSLKNYSEKKRILGIDDNMSTGGMEYYSGGIFEIGEPEGISSREQLSSPYIDFFDWRNRHGKNWVSPNKNQGESGYCHFFHHSGLHGSHGQLVLQQSLEF